MQMTQYKVLRKQLDVSEITKLRQYYKVFRKASPLYKALKEGCKASYNAYSVLDAPLTRAYQNLGYLQPLTNNTPLGGN
jgi:hypothetical protein